MPFEILLKKKWTAVMRIFGPPIEAMQRMASAQFAAWQAFFIFILSAIPHPEFQPLRTSEFIVVLTSF